MSVPCSRDPLTPHEEALSGFRNLMIPEKKGILGKLKARKGELISKRERKKLRKDK